MNTSRMKDADKILSRAFGAFLRKRRIMAGLSQEAMAKEIGITFQQVQKYESGANRISLPRAVTLANVIGIQPGDFFKVVEGDGGKVLSRKYLDALSVLITFEDKELDAFHGFATALGKKG